jgi:hypothetical protein
MFFTPRNRVEIRPSPVASVSVHRRPSTNGATGSGRLASPRAGRVRRCRAGRKRPALVRHGRCGARDRPGAGTRRHHGRLVERHGRPGRLVAELGRVSGSAAIGPRDTLRSWRAATAGLHLPPVGVVARFGSPEQVEFPHGQRRSADSLVATLATRAGSLVMPEQERRATLGRIRAFLASRSETSSDDFALPMLSGVLRVRQL